MLATTNEWEMNRGLNARSDGEEITKCQHRKWHLFNDWWEFMPHTVAEVINIFFEYRWPWFIKHGYSYSISWLLFLDLPLLFVKSFVWAKEFSYASWHLRDNKKVFLFMHVGVDLKNEIMPWGSFKTWQGPLCSVYLLVEYTFIGLYSSLHLFRYRRL